MKSFIVAAMVVAAVAGQSFDMFNKYGQDKSILMNKYYGNDMLYKKLGYPMDMKLGYPMMDKSMVYGQRDLINLPYLQDQYVDQSKVFTIDEIYNTELFREYLSLPLFREWITTPMFKSYVQSVYFQKFWTVPAFKQYFVQPTLFYKFIYPIVQLFKFDTTTTDYEQEIVNKNVNLPFVSGYERDLFVPTYTKEIQNGMYYKNILEKLFNQFYNVDETTHYQNKIVDPITGEIKMIPFQGVDTIFGEKLVKDLLLKKFLINKAVDVDTVFGDEFITDMLTKNIDTEVLKKILLSQKLDNVFGDKLHMNKLIMKNVDVDFLKTLLTKTGDVELIKMIMLQKMLGQDLTTMIPQEYLKEKMSPMVARMTYGMNYNKGFPLETKMNLFDIMGKKPINEIEKMNLFDILTKKDLAIKDKMVLNKILLQKANEIENFGTYETIPKMDVTKFERVPLTLEGVKPMMGVRTFDKVIKA